MGARGPFCVLRNQPLFCDDLREEKSGMDTLVGVHPDNINVPSFPFSFPKIAIYTRINLDAADSPGDISIVISVPNEDDVLLSTLDTEMITNAQTKSKKDGSAMVGLISKAIAANFTVPAPGQVKITVKIKGKKYVGGVLNVKLIPESGSPTA